jgi:hypothetical protein
MPAGANGGAVLLLLQNTIMTKNLTMALTGCLHDTAQ